MDTQLEVGDEFADFIDFPSVLLDSGGEPQYDFSDASFDLHHQYDAFWNAPNATEDQTVVNQFVVDETLNDDAQQPEVDILQHLLARHSKPRRQRLTKAQKSCLNSWFLSHQSYCYPTAEEVGALAVETCLTEKQVRTWFNNARSRKGPQSKPTLHSQYLSCSIRVADVKLVHQSLKHPTLHLHQRRAKKFQYHAQGCLQKPP
jgi:hypothetical protein